MAFEPKKMLLIAWRRKRKKRKRRDAVRQSETGVVCFQSSQVVDKE
jgi:hypothetical protein